MEAIKPERKRGQRMHAVAIEEGTTCIVCHYNLVHKEVEPSKAFLEAIEGK
jgi:nitrate/TMAO reductase-like tetraheme cytochrome c subunit